MKEEDYKAILTLVSCLGTEATWQDYADIISKIVNYLITRI